MTILSRKFYHESGSYKEPDDVVKIVNFKAETEYDDIAGIVTARKI